MKIKEIISIISNIDYYSITNAIRAANLHKEDCVVENYNFSKHKYFDITTNIYKCDDGFIGITGLLNNRKKKDYEEFNIPAFAEEYQEIQTVSYIPKIKR